MSNCCEGKIEVFRKSPKSSFWGCRAACFFLKPLELLVSKMWFELWLSFMAQECKFGPLLSFQVERTMDVELFVWLVDVL